MFLLMPVAMRSPFFRPDARALAGVPCLFICLLIAFGMTACGGGERPADRPASVSPVRLSAGIQPLVGRFDPTMAVAPLYEEAKQRYEAARYAEAAPLFAAITLKFSDHNLAPHAVHFLALTALKLDDLDGCHEAFTWQLDHYPQSDEESKCEAYFHLGNIELTRGHEIAARQWWQKILTEHGTSRWAAWAKEKIDRTQSGACCPGQDSRGNPIS
jgi:TolA-binding protein